MEADPFAVAALENGQLLAVSRQHLRRLLQLGFADVADAGRQRYQHQHIQKPQRWQRHQPLPAPRAQALPQWLYMRPQCLTARRLLECQQPALLPRGNLLRTALP